MKKKLVIIGCGPKAIAIHLKNEALKKQGYETPEIIIIEKNEVGGNWSGKNGFTDGSLRLGISPEKDFGYPYQSEFGSDIDEKLFEYSWNKFLIDTNRYSEWIDRGKKNPTHNHFSQYMAWAVQKSQPNLLIDTLTSVEKKSDQWEISTKNTDKKILADGIVFTGPGKQNAIPMPKNNKNIFNGKEFWKHTDKFFNLKNAKIGVIGAGETNATVLTKLLDLVDHNSVSIDIVNRHASVFTRSENYFENRYFSHPKHWQALTEKERNELIFRADRSTFSAGQKDLIDNSYIVHMVSGSAEKIEEKNNKLILTTTHKETETHEYDYIITGMGTDNFSFTNFFPQTNFTSKDETIKNVQNDLSINNISPTIHVPMLAGFAQGIGFPNLSCLGALSDRILKPYIKK